MSIRSYIALVLLSLFLFQGIGKYVVYAHFYLNRNFIAQELCEQKAVAENTCQGKCYLKKQLNHQEEQQKQLATVLKSKVEVFFESHKQRTSIVVASTFFEAPIASYFFSNQSVDTDPIPLPPRI